MIRGGAPEGAGFKARAANAGGQAPRTLAECYCNANQLFWLARLPSGIMFGERRQAVLFTVCPWLAMSYIYSHHYGVLRWIFCLVVIDLLLHPPPTRIQPQVCSLTHSTMAPSRKQSYGPSVGSDPTGNVSRSSTTTTTSSGRSGSTASTALDEILKQNPQIVTDRYVKEEKLNQYLASTYGPGQWKVHVRGVLLLHLLPEMMEVLFLCIISHSDKRLPHGRAA